MPNIKIDTRDCGNFIVVVGAFKKNIIFEDKYKVPSRDSLQGRRFDAIILDERISDEEIVRAMSSHKGPTIGNGNFKIKK